ncbi:UPF0415 protein C7orf25 homolog [Trichonephila inaurata madagascariensis]|uniref:UPF0415 protein C7orf25 homolog n=1 Tax=Trichonephila inaurata madagascariensis TaxID=2747483 RepID=A0A8X6YGV1_9ARAC|nr:UPF0415 protein C7orf25 homolog [Trichonephila inaurata madagascariensis]
MSESQDDIYNGLLKKIEETERLIEECKKLSDISGKPKLQRKIEAELKFLKRLTKNRDKLKEEHIRSSNIYHLTAIVRCCAEMQGVIKVLETFSYVIEEEGEMYELSLTVDIVADYGKTWVKVATRNPFHLYQASVGHGKYGRKSIVEQVEDMVDCASQNHHMFAAPKIIVRLAAGVTKELKELLDELGVQVIGEIISPDCKENFNDMCNKESEFHDSLQNQLTSLENIHLNINEDSEPSSSDTIIIDSNDESTFFNIQSIPANATLNLDVSTFLAYVSNMTNGHCHAKYKEKLLMDLAEMERAHAVKPVLDQLFQGRKLVCCETAHRDFLEILSTVGGESEKQRASEMLNKVSIVPDNPSPKALALEKTSKIKERSKIVFGTGDSMKAVTVSANLGFLRAAQSQGIKFVAFVHESRALTECKELKNDDSKC